MAAWRRALINKRMRSKISPCISSCRVVRGGLLRGNFENQECRRSHLRSFCNAIKFSNILELCLFADVSDEKAPIYSMFLNVLEAGRVRSVSRRSRVRSSCRHILSWRFGHEKHSTTILSLPLAKECALSKEACPGTVWIS